MYILVIICSFKNVAYTTYPGSLNFVLLSAMLELNHSRINTIPLYTTRSKIRNKKITAVLPFYKNSINYVKVYILYIYF